MSMPFCKPRDRSSESWPLTCRRKEPLPNPFQPLRLLATPHLLHPLIPAPWCCNYFALFQIKTEDLSDSLQSTIPPRSGHLVQGSSMMPGSQIAGVSDFAASGIQKSEMALVSEPLEKRLVLRYLPNYVCLWTVAKRDLRVWWTLNCVGKSQLPPQPLSFLQKVLHGFKGRLDTYLAEISFEGFLSRQTTPCSGNPLNWK